MFPQRVVTEMVVVRVVRIYLLPWLGMTSSGKVQCEEWRVLT